MAQHRFYKSLENRLVIVKTGEKNLGDMILVGELEKYNIIREQAGFDQEEDESVSEKKKDYMIFNNSFNNSPGFFYLKNPHFMIIGQSNSQDNPFKQDISLGEQISMLLIHNRTKEYNLNRNGILWTKGEIGLYNPLDLIELIKNYLNYKEKNSISVAHIIDKFYNGDPKIA